MNRKPILHEYDSQGDYDPNNYNFQIGAPHPSELIECSKIVQNAIVSISQQEDYLRSSCFQYGTETGSDPARQALAKFLSEEHGIPIAYENLMVTCGASLTLNLVCNQFFGWKQGGEQPVAFVEHPTYFLALDMLEGLGFKVFPIPRKDSDNQTIDFEAWKTLLKQNCSLIGQKQDGKFAFRGLVYLIPTFHNPTGTCLSKDTAMQIYNICEDENFLIHCDDVYNSLYYTTAVPERVLPVGKSNRIISAGSFSKLLGPGLRIGWLESSTDIIQKVASSGVVVSGGCLNQFGSYLIERAINNGDIISHVRDLRAKYKAKVDVLTEIFSRDLPKSVIWCPPKGGYFIWLRLPKGNDKWLANELVPQAKEMGIKFQLGVRSCTATRVGQECNLGCSDSIRLSIGHVTVKQTAEGSKILCELIQKHLQ